jgi:DNA-binding transcriptional LysR family regulator
VKLAAPLSFGARWVAPILPAFFRQYPDVAIDLHLTDAHTDLIGDGFDAALRIAIMEDSSLAARLIVPVRRFLVASPNYIARYGRPQHPHDLGAHQCLSYANRAKRDIWRFTHQASGEECPIRPTGRLRGTSIEALLPTVLEGLAITELPEFAATQYFREKQLEPLLTDWRLPEGGLYFVTPTARARPEPRRDCTRWGNERHLSPEANHASRLACGAPFSLKLPDVFKTNERVEFAE